MRLVLLASALILAGCGMNRAVGVLPNTADDLAAIRAGTERPVDPQR